MDFSSSFCLYDETLCRTCLQKLEKEEEDSAIEHKHRAIFLDEDLAEKLITLTSLSVEPTDIYPKYLCFNCFNLVNDFHEFRSRCVASLRHFQELVLVTEDEKPIIHLNDYNNTNLTSGERVDVSMPEQLEPGVQNSIEVCLPALMEQTKKLAEPAEEANADIEIKTEEFTSTVNDFVTQETINALETSDDDSTWCPPPENSKASQKKSKNTKKTKVSSLKATVKPSRTLQHQCELCSKRFFELSSLEAHKRKHEGLRPYPCPHEGCKSAYNRSTHLRIHMKKHEDSPEWFKCTVEGCDKKYTYKGTLIAHHRAVHEQGSEPKKPYICEVCGKAFKTNHLLSQHSYMHKDKSELPFVCDQPNCQRRFSKKDKLEDHLRRHAGIKNYVCTFCGLRTTTNSELTKHINYHTRQRTWPCRACEKVFNNCGNLKRHVRTVHELARDYPCQYCERSFAKPYTRKYHEMTHTGEKPEVCKECGKRFIQPTALQTHMKTHERQRLKTAAVSKPSTKFNM